MNWLLPLLFAILWAVPPVPATTQPEGEQFTIPRLLVAIRQVESAGDSNAVGDGGRSRGPYQITRKYWADAWKGYHNPPAYLAWANNDSVCRAAILRYWRRYAGPETDRACLTRAVPHDWEVLARIHNGGPQGASKESTRAYWLRVKTEMKKETQ